MQKEHFDYAPSVVEKIKEQDTIWFGQPVFNVTLEVSRDVAFYFERKALHQNKKSSEKQQDGSLVISSCLELQPNSTDSSILDTQYSSSLSYELDTYTKNLTSWLDQTSSQTESEVL